MKELERITFKNSHVLKATSEKLQQLEIKLGQIDPIVASEFTPKTEFQTMVKGFRAWKSRLEVVENLGLPPAVETAVNTEELLKIILDL